MTTQRLIAAPVVSALAVGSTERDQIALQRAFREWGWNLHLASSMSEARAFLDRIPVDVVLSDRELPDGGWREMLTYLQALTDPPELVVKSRLAADSFWAEVLNMGGYDVLAEPLDNEELRRVVGAAARRSVNERQRRAPAASAPLVLRAAS
jgi:DNA-binding response OmpR family regulator